MDEKQPYEQDLAEIRSLMEKSAKFISLSGLSGILAGVYALLGAAAAYGIAGIPLTSGGAGLLDGFQDHTSMVVKLSAIAFVVLAASLATGFILSARKAKQNDMEFWNTTSRRLVINLAVPLVTGGLFIILLILQEKYGLVAPVCLLFYGLALMNASPNLFDEARYLGYSEIALGLIGVAIPGYGFMIWTIGFGAFHVFYGAIMYRKYDR